MVYWLMAMNKEKVRLAFKQTNLVQAKKLGVFVNFRDFKGNTGEALSKMIGDLRKFGIQVARNCQPEHLKSGYGEVVCHLIDELLNVELFRREYQFYQPKFPPEDDLPDLDESGYQDDDPSFHGTQELHGI